jgi:hypothetical protein
MFAPEHNVQNIRVETSPEKKTAVIQEDNWTHAPNFYSLQLRERRKK